MSKDFKVKDVYEIGKNPSPFFFVEMVDLDDEVDTECGLNFMFIKEEQIEELKNGKAIYFSDGEYAHLVVLEKKVNEDEQTENS